MANINYDIIDPAILTEYARTFDNEVLKNTFILDQFLPNKEIADLDYKIRKGTFLDVDVAKYRAFDTPSVMTNRQGTSQIKGSIPAVSRQIALGEEETLRLEGMLRSDQSGIIAAIYDDTERMVRSVQARIEVARGQLLSTGTVVLQENGLDLTYDSGLSGLSGHMPVAAASWATTTTKIITDLLAWQQKYIDDTGFEPGLMIMSKKIEGYMFLNDDVRASATFGNATTPSRLNRELIRAVFDSLGLPPYVLYDTVVRIDGVQTRVIPEDKLIMLTPGELMGNTFYGITAEAIKLAAKGYIKQSAMPGIVALVTEQDHPVATYTNATAIALPVLPNPELLLVADVIP